ncbi:MOSC domain-containing protein [Cryptosporangium phraense]|uniref:MOSC domain-containing protein n=1 Tax=Cryptosporangium phraense TaxID=2593070 RepID=A0A545AKT3_9ACTN|nr:MOSC N-terminal beta barrel domain-containing protein [Cryptosporangium phraense]TQS41918.1 MOSC domain-containing protein [Cryptosporangium phraense]
MITVGRVAALYRYPVKSMAAEPVDAIEVSWHGLAGDRRWGFVRPGNMSGFPWLTLRERNDLARYVPRLADPGVVVRTPSGTSYDVLDPELARELGGIPMKLDRGTFDSAPISLLTTRALRDLAALVGETPDPLRFRPNVVIETDEPEEAWVGGSVTLGEVRVRADRRDRRCVVVNVDPSTGRRTPQTLRAIATRRGNTFGVYGSVELPGRLAIGDPVTAAARPGTCC